MILWGSNSFAFPKNILWVIQHASNTPILYRESSVWISEPAGLIAAYIIFYVQTILLFSLKIFYFILNSSDSVGWLAFWYTLFSGVPISTMVDLNLPCHWVQNWEEMHTTSSPKPLWGNPAHEVAVLQDEDNFMAI